MEPQAVVEEGLEGRSRQAIVWAAEKVCELVSRGWTRPRSFWVLGPNFDSSFWYRLNGNEGRLDIGAHLKWKRLEAEALATGIIPKFEAMSEEERRIVFMASFLTRVKTLNDITSRSTAGGMALVVKHFPAAMGSHQEQGERVSVHLETPLEDMLKFQVPFTDSFLCSTPAKAVMMSHTAFPVAEKELKAQNILTPEELSKCHSTSVATVVPSSLSPIMLRGLLRKSFGFTGVVISDWACMGAVTTFTSNPKNFPPDMAELSSPARLAITAVEAGLDFCLGFRSVFPAEAVPEIQRYANEHPYWISLLDETLRHAFSWLKSLGNVVPSGWEPPALDTLNLEDKIAFYFGNYYGETTNPLLAPVQKFVDTQNYEDVCFRGGVFTSLLRYFYLRATSKDQSVRLHLKESLDPTKFQTTKEWVDKAKADPVYLEAYNKEDWTKAFTQDPATTINELVEAMAATVGALPPVPDAPTTPVF